MSTRDRKRLVDGWLTLEAGVDSGKAANLIGQNQCAFMVNASARGGWPQPRPGWRKINLNFNGDADMQTAFEEALLQVAGGYVTPEQNGSLISMHSGKQFRVNLSNSSTFTVQDISIPGDINNPTRTKAWALQAENYFIIQDDQSKAFIYDGGGSRRADPVQREVPVGGPMAYFMGRIWVRVNKTSFVAGDIVNGPTEIINFTENEYLNEGGAFGVPLQAGEITAMLPIAALDTATGQGALVVGTRNAVFFVSPPVDRDTWKNTTDPIQRIVQINFGPLSNFVNVNGDLYYRAADGVRSLISAIRLFGQPGNTPISNEMNRIFERDDVYLRDSAVLVNFDNRMLTTASFARSDRGVYARGMVPLDFDLITSMRDKLPPAWEGIWTGLKILKTATVEHQGVDRCFAYVVGTDDKIEIWELTRDDKNDNDTSRIIWSIESRSLDFGSKFDMKELDGGDIYYDRVSGRVDFEIQYRNDGMPCWADWKTWDECANTALCEDNFGTCPNLKNLQEQFRAKYQLTKPPEVFAGVTKELINTGYEFQPRIQITGFCRLKQTRFIAHDVQEMPAGRQL